MLPNDFRYECPACGSMGTLEDTHFGDTEIWLACGDCKRRFALSEIGDVS